MNVVVVAYVEEFLPYELDVIVGDDHVGYTKAVDDVGEECYGFLGAGVDNGPSFNTLGELVNRHEQVCEAPGRLSEWPTMSRCHIAKGHVMGMVCSACAGR
jgi:hypothetical protein